MFGCHRLAAVNSSCCDLQHATSLPASAAIVADQNAKLSIFATRPAIYTPVSAERGSPSSLHPSSKAACYFSKAALPALAAFRSANHVVSTAVALTCHQTQVFNFLTELMCTAALVFGALMMYERREHISGEFRGLFQAIEGALLLLVVHTSAGCEDRWADRWLSAGCSAICPGACLGSFVCVSPWAWAAWRLCTCAHSSSPGGPLSMLFVYGASLKSG